jgi:DNA-binding response OmpR family regulator
MKLLIVEDEPNLLAILKKDSQSLNWMVKLEMI